MRFGLLPIVLFAALFTQVLADVSAHAAVTNPGPLLKWSRRGRDSSGNVVREILRLAVGGEIEWSYAGIGGMCPDKGGDSVGKATRELAHELATLARAAIAEQNKLASANARETSSRVVSTMLEVEEGDKFDEAVLIQAGPAWDALEDKLLELRELTKPVSGVQLRASTTGDGVATVSFELRGTSSFKVLLPHTAAEAFSADSGPVNYAETPAKLDILLTHDQPRATARLRLGAGKARKILYSNATIQHHGKSEEGLDWLEPLALCAYVTSSKR